MKFITNKKTVFILTVIILNILKCSQCFADDSIAYPQNTSLHGSRWLEMKQSLAEDLYLTKQNVIAVGTLPLKFDKYNWVVTTAILGSTAIAFFGDQPVQKLFRAHQSSTADNIFIPGHYYGSYSIAIGLGGSMYLYGLGFSQAWLQETGREVIISLALAGVATGILKVVCGRARPNMDEGSGDFDFFAKSNSSQSFPSGHATVAFALSSVLASRISNPYATIGLFGLATLTGMQRMYSDNHWLSDVIMGASIGTVIGQLVTKNSREPKEISRINWNVVPDFTFSGAGVGLIGSF